MSDSKEVVNIKVDVQGLTEAEKDAKAIEGALKKIDSTLKKAERSGKGIADAMKKLDGQLKKVESSADGIANALKKVGGSLKESSGIALDLSRNLATANKQVLMMVGNVGRLVVALTAAASQAGLISRSLAGGAIPPIIPGGGGRRGGAIVPVGGGGRARGRAAPPAVINLPGRPPQLALPPYAGRDSFRIERRMQRLQVTKMKREARLAQLHERFKAGDAVRLPSSSRVVPFPSNRARPRGGGPITGGGQVSEFRSRKQLAIDAKARGDLQVWKAEYAQRKKQYAQEEIQRAKELKLERSNRASELLEYRARGKGRHITPFPTDRVKPSVGSLGRDAQVFYPFRRINPDSYLGDATKGRKIDVARMDIREAFKSGKFSPRDIVRKMKRVSQFKHIAKIKEDAFWKQAKLERQIPDNVLAFPHRPRRTRGSYSNNVVDLRSRLLDRTGDPMMIDAPPGMNLPRQTPEELARVQQRLDEYKRLQKAEFKDHWRGLEQRNTAIQQRAILGSRPLDYRAGGVRAIATRGGSALAQSGGSTYGATALQRDPLVPYGGIVPYRGRGRGGLGGGRVIDVEWEDRTPRGYLGRGRQGQQGTRTIRTGGPPPSRLIRSNIIKGKHVYRAPHLGGASPQSVAFRGGGGGRGGGAGGGGVGGGVGGGAAETAGAAGMNRLGRGAGRAANKFQRADKAIAGFHRSLSLFLRTVATAGVLGFGAYYAAQAADSYTVLQNKLRTVTDSEEQLNTVTEKVIDLALETRSPVQDVATAFRRFDLAVQDSGGSQQESLLITEAVTKGMKAAGATAAETSQGLIQLSQAFNKGKLDGDELRSVSENMPPVFYGLAKSLGVTRGALYDMGRTGKLTGDLLRSSILENLPAIREEFKKLKVPIGDAFLNIRTATLRLFGTWDKFHGHTSDISSFFLDVAKDAGLLVTVLGSVTTAFAGLLSVGVAKGLAGLAAKFAIAPLAPTLTAITVAATAGVPWIIRYSDHIKLLEKGLYLSADATEGQKKAFRKLADESNILASITDSYTDEQERLNEVMDKTPNPKILSFLATLKGLLVSLSTELEYQAQHWERFAKIAAGVLGGIGVGVGVNKKFGTPQLRSVGGILKYTRKLGAKGMLASATLGGVAGGIWAATTEDESKKIKSRKEIQKEHLKEFDALVKWFDSAFGEKGSLRGKGKKRGKDTDPIGKMEENFRENFKLLAAMENQVDARFGLRTAEQLEGSAKTLEFRKQNIHYLDKEQVIIDGWVSKFQKRVDDEDRIEEIAKSRLNIDNKIEKANVNLLSGLRTEKQRHQDIKGILSDINEFELQGVSYSKTKVGVLKEEERILKGRLDRAKIVEGAQGAGPRSAIVGLETERRMLGTALDNDEVSDSEKVGVGERLQAINEEIKEKNNQILLESESFLDQFGVRVEEVWTGIGDRISGTFAEIFGQLITYGSKTKAILGTLQSALNSLAKEFAGSFLKSAVGSLSKILFSQTEAVAKQEAFNFQIKASPAAIQKMSAAEVGAMVKKTAATKTLGAVSTGAAVPTAAVDWSAIPRALAMMAILGLGSFGLSKLTSGMGGDGPENSVEAARKAAKDTKIKNLERKLEEQKTRASKGISGQTGGSGRFDSRNISLLQEFRALQQSAGTLATSGVNFSTDLISESGYSATISPGAGVPALQNQMGFPLASQMSPQVSIVNVIVSSEDELDNYLNSDMGQDTIVNVIRRNASDIRDEIA